MWSYSEHGPPDLGPIEYILEWEYSWEAADDTKPLPEPMLTYH